MCGIFWDGARCCFLVGYIMHGVEIAETDHKLVLILDKDVLPRTEIEEARHRYEESDALDVSHLEYVSDKEQADLEAILNAMTDEDKEIVYSHHVNFHE